MLARMMAFLVWGLLACSVVYWLIQLMARPVAAPLHAQAVLEQRSGTADLTRLFGAAPVAAPEVALPADSRFSLLGVVAPRNLQASQAGEGVALIAVDGVPRTVRIGAVLDGELRLLSVQGNSAQLGRDGVVSMTLNLAPPLPAATGSLPPAANSPTVLGGQPMLQGEPAQAPFRPALPPGQPPAPGGLDSNALPTR
ncbi:hypothetical protein LNV23_18495 [Paucibacter sp. DJ1R-11]|uniref:hypothetical protein n=1 Tax=Paucibacter sp. DJ1R-11 TaxID=2893556 RepID=UPI0021E4F400|nr:hypothetical protein [Paucibacter sp. DJ1R-11]MCV2365442.1 hypothetical protein [Paucibacter sp. DJ1R-11]